MSKEEFIEKYGVNLAIRAECKGRNELLDTLEIVSSMRSRARSKDEASPEQSKIVSKVLEMRW